MTEPAAESTDQTTETESPEQESSNREAAKYRRQLRDTEAERDTLAQRVEAMQRAEVERLAGSTHRIAQPAALWASGATLHDLLGEDGHVDPEKVKTAAENAISTLGLARTKPAGVYAPREGRIPEPSRPRASWDEFLSRQD